MRLTFDRGTILVTGDADPEMLDDLPGLRWDPRVRAYRAPGIRHSEVASGLATRGVRFSDDAGQLLEAPTGWSAIALRAYQKEALRAWHHRGKRGVIVLPTGSGKTVVGLAAMARLGTPALCLVPTRVLLDQWVTEIGRHHANRVGRYGDGARELAPITVATFESAYRHMETLGNRFGLLVIDEAHHFGAGLRDEALEMSIAPARLGLTATPVGDEEARARSAWLIGPVVYELGIGDLAGTFLADFDVVVYRVDLTPEERARYDRLAAIFHGQRWDRDLLSTREGQKIAQAWRQARMLVSLCAAKREALAEILARHRDARMLIFVADNHAAYALAREHLIMPFTCDIKRRERDDALGRFRRGELRVLVSAQVLNEGLDVPDADVAVIVGGALGPREHVQRIGRLLRPAPGKRALVYELVARGTLEVGQARRRRRGLAARGTARLSDAG